MSFYRKLICFVLILTVFVIFKNDLFAQSSPLYDNFDGKGAKYANGANATEKGAISSRLWVNIDKSILEDLGEKKKKALFLSVPENELGTKSLVLNYPLNLDFQQLKEFSADVFVPSDNAAKSYKYGLKVSAGILGMKKGIFEAKIYIEARKRIKRAYASILNPSNKSKVVKRVKVQPGKWHNIKIVFPKGKNSVTTASFYCDKKLILEKEILDSAILSDSKSLSWGLKREIYIDKSNAADEEKLAYGYIDNIRADSGLNKRCKFAPVYDDFDGNGCLWQ